MKVIEVHETIARFTREKGGKGTFLVRPSSLREVDQMHETGIPASQVSGKVTQHTERTLAEGISAATNQTHKVVALVPAEHKGRIPPEWIIGALVVRRGSFVPNSHFDPNYRA